MSQHALAAASTAEFSAEEMVRPRQCAHTLRHLPSHQRQDFMAQQQMVQIVRKYAAAADHDDDDDADDYD